MRVRPAALAAALFLVALAGCATLQQIGALRQVRFDFDRVTDVRVAGVRADGRDAFSDLGVEDIARIAAAISARRVPLEFVAHVRAENPDSNRITARLLALDWKLYLDERHVLDGALDRAYDFEPGSPVDVPVAVAFDAYALYEHNGPDLFELALGIAGVEGHRTEVRLDLVPTVSTDLGPIRYPTPIVLRRTTGR